LNADRTGLRHVAGGSYAWLQGDGGWGLSNAGVVVGEDEAVLVDTLFDLPHTRTMMSQLGPLTAGTPIRTVVNTHGNGDHWFGNALLDDQTRIVAASGTLDDMRAVGPDTVARLLQTPGQVGAFGRRIFGAFEFASIRPRYPTETYEVEHHVSLRGVDLLLVDVGPAHTSADTIVYCERDGVVFTGDIVFAAGTPIMWEGPTENWLRACARIRELGARYLVPGHGPISPMSRLREMSDYLELVREQAARRHALGMSIDQAARDIDLGSFTRWPEAERLAANVATIYRELSSSPTPPTPGPVMFGCMASLRDHWDALRNGADKATEAPQR
jgi:glyoxylase-like metal-dependent hydrolase (beta-lactamase superfamily II)